MRKSSCALQPHRTTRENKNIDGETKLGRNEIFARASPKRRGQARAKCRLAPKGPQRIYLAIYPSIWRSGRLISGTAAFNSLSICSSRARERHWSPRVVRYRYHNRPFQFPQPPPGARQAPRACAQTARAPIASSADRSFRWELDRRRRWRRKLFRHGSLLEQCFGGSRCRRAGLAAVRLGPKRPRRRKQKCTRNVAPVPIAGHAGLE